VLLIAKAQVSEKESRDEPARSRRCKSEVLQRCHWETGKAWRMMMLEPEDLPDLNHRKLYER
jgi:hypothetical protein